MTECLLFFGATLYAVAMLALLWWAHRTGMRRLDAAETEWRRSFVVDRDANGKPLMPPNRLVRMGLHGGDIGPP